jgi:hypothetical protein
LFAQELPNIQNLEAHCGTHWMPLLARILGGVRQHEADLSPDATAASVMLCPLPMEVAAVATLLTHGMAYMQRVACATAARATEPGVTPAEAVWLEELHASQMATLELVTRMHALLAACQLSSVAAYTSVAGMMVEFMISHVVSSMACFQQRKAWVTELGALAGGDAAGAEEAACGGGRKPLLQLLEPPGVMLGLDGKLAAAR